MVDHTKKSNIKCEHCRYREKHSGEVTCKEVPMFPGVETLKYLTVCQFVTDMDICRCEDSPKANKPVYYYNRCKKFEWSD